MIFDFFLVGGGVNYPFNTCSLVSQLTHIHLKTCEWVSAHGVKGYQSRERTTGHWYQWRVYFDLDWLNILWFNKTLYRASHVRCACYATLHIQYDGSLTDPGFESMFEWQTMCQCISSISKKWLQSYRITDLGTTTWHITHFSRREWDWG